MTREEFNKFIQKNNMDYCGNCKHLYYSNVNQEECNIKECKFEATDALWEEFNAEKTYTLDDLREIVEEASESEDDDKYFDTSDSIDMLLSYLEDIEASDAGKGSED